MQILSFWTDATTGSAILRTFLRILMVRFIPRSLPQKFLLVLRQMHRVRRCLLLQLRRKFFATA